MVGGEGGELRVRFWIGIGIEIGVPGLVSVSVSSEGESEGEIGCEGGAGLEGGLWGESIVGLGRVGGEEVGGHSGFSDLYLSLGMCGR